MRYPKLIPNADRRTLIRSFGGYNHNEAIAAGELYDSCNLSAEQYPLLCTRPMRQKQIQQLDGRSLSSVLAALPAAEHLLTVDSQGNVACGSGSLPAFVSTSQHMLPKKLVGMGAYVCIFPDKKYVNAVKLAAGDSLSNGTDYGKMDALFTLTASGGMRLLPCLSDGTLLTGAVLQGTEPTEKQDKMLWADSSANTHTLKQWDASAMQWVQLSTCVMICANNIAAQFSQHDSVSLCASGISFYFERYDTDEMRNAIYAQLKAVLNQSCTLAQVYHDPGDAATERAEGTNDYIIVPGLLDQTQEGVRCSSLQIERKIPELDFVVECGNRLWGCFYGEQNGTHINEIYASALGDFKNWEQFQGISSDSYRASRGRPAPYTGAAVLGGCPLFFREQSLEKVYPSATGAHRIVSLDCDGIQAGSWRSAVVIDERLYYYSPAGVCVYSGSLPQRVSRAFGPCVYREAAAHCRGKRYYLSVLDAAASTRRLFVLDTEKGIWHCEDPADFSLSFVFDGSIYYRDGESWSAICDQASRAEEICWFLETGPIGASLAENSYISRILLRMELAQHARLRLYTSYDAPLGREQWQLRKSVEYTTQRSFTLTVSILPRRCDHLRLRIEGEGGWKLYSLSYLTESGSDENR